jgi:flavodoxin
MEKRELKKLYKRFINKGEKMEKEMLVVAKFKEGEGKFEKFMGFMQSPEGLAERAKVAVVEKTIGSVTPDKSAVMFKIFCTDEAALHTVY